MELISAYRFSLLKSRQYNQANRKDVLEENQRREKAKKIIDDVNLVEKSKKGDKAAFEELVKLYSKYVYTNAFFILRDSYEAEDVSQEVFVKVYLSIKNFRGLSSFKTWIRKLTVNTCIDKLRVKSKTFDKKIKPGIFRRKP